jgi:competence protein ComEA
MQAAGTQSCCTEQPKPFVYKIGGDVLRPGFYCFGEQKTVKQLADAAGTPLDRSSGALYAESPVRAGSSVTFGDKVTIGEISAQARMVFYLPLPVNTVCAEGLTCIPGIGIRTAERIIAFRDSRGGIRTIDELMAVRGIGAQRLKLLKQYLSADPSELHAPVLRDGETHLNTQ